MDHHQHHNHFNNYQQQPLVHTAAAPSHIPSQAQPFLISAMEPSKPIQRPSGKVPISQTAGNNMESRNITSEQPNNSANQLGTYKVQVANVGLVASNASPFSAAHFHRDRETPVQKKRMGNRAAQRVYQNNKHHHLVGEAGGNAPM